MEIAVTLATGLMSAIVAIITCMVNNNMQRVKEQHAIELRIAEVNANYDKTTALIKSQINELAKDVSKHNNLIDRMYSCEDRLNVIETKVQGFHGA